MMSWLARQDGYDPNAFDVPGEQTYDRRFDQTWPGQLAQDAIGAVLAPGRALQSTEPITTEQMIKPAVDLAGLVTGGSYAAPAQKGASGAGIRAYHSSPHDFDKFDLSKIGSGEGAQSYGHGLYFAENPAVSGQGGQYWQQFMRKFGDTEYLAANKLKQAGFDRDAAALMAQKEIDALTDAVKTGTHPPGVSGGPFDEHTNRSIAKNMLYDRQQQLDMLRSGKPVGPRTYEVNINADPAHMLDWDKPLREQSGHVKNTFFDWADDNRHRVTSDMSGQRAHGIISETVGSPNASNVWSDAGIPGIKYLDEGSRGVPTVGTGHIQAAGPGKFNIVDDFGIQAGPFPTLEQAQQYLNPGKRLTSNYVIFDPNIVRIDKKYAVPGAIGAGGMGALAAQNKYEEVY